MKQSHPHSRFSLLFFNLLSTQDPPPPPPPPPYNICYLHIRKRLFPPVQVTTLVDRYKLRKCTCQVVVFRVHTGTIPPVKCVQHSTEVFFALNGRTQGGTSLIRRLDCTKHKPRQLKSNKEGRNFLSSYSTACRNSPNVIPTSEETPQKNRNQTCSW